MKETKTASHEKTRGQSDLLHLIYPCRTPDLAIPARKHHPEFRHLRGAESDTADCVESKGQGEPCNSPAIGKASVLKSCIFALPKKHNCLEISAKGKFQKGYSSTQKGCLGTHVSMCSRVETTMGLLVMSLAYLLIHEDTQLFSDPGKKGNPFWGRPSLVGPPQKKENHWCH